ncbi:uncharacterized protein PRCAT00001810001 [Priceomyces carsonii]|uniref:uncharacterized protein n=1 Tax=Priceomyces carsonii TaxID=28549 RepID=UPI002ED7B186|nr:unnamed protein product [Priceomyces carsonii]
MSANIFGSDDPWENGWTADDSEASKSAIQTFGASEYLTSSQLLSNRGSVEDIRDNPFETNEARVPQSYKKVAENLSSKLTTVNDIEPVLLNKIVTLGYLTDFQRMNIMNVIRDNNILPPSKPDNLYKILGLIAMEIDTSGSGDYVSLQFNLNDLPDLPEKVVAELVTDQQEVSGSLIDPLTTHLNTTSLTDKDWRSSSEYSDPLLVNHAQIKSNETESNLEHDVDQTEVKRYINDIRDGFQPLINSSDLITIKEVPEKEGLLFKHINYVISHEVQLGMNGHAGVKKVIRRYADFVW